MASVGKIPKSFSVPFHEILKGVFQWTNSDFKIRYGFEKPAKDANLIISCRKGIRALKAGNYLRRLGYKNVRIYKGGISDWIKNGGEIINEGNCVNNRVL